MKTDTSGAYARKDGSVVLCCQDCGKFIRHGESTERVGPSVGDPFAPHYEVIHAAGFGCRRTPKQ